MTALRTLLSSHRHIALALLLFALLQRAIIPDGFMPGERVSPGISIEFCGNDLSDSTASKILLNAARRAPGHRGSKSGSCPFGALNAPLTLGMPVAIIAGITWFASTIQRMTHLYEQAPAWKHGLMPSRAPPSRSFQNTNGT